MLFKVHELLSQTYLRHCEKKLQPTYKCPEGNGVTSLKTTQLLLNTEGMSSGFLSANKQTADGLCVESFTSPGARPAQNSSVIILRIWIKPPLSACWHITLWLCYCSGIYSPVGYCKAWFLCQHQLQPAGITEPLWMGSYLLWVLCSKVQGRLVWFYEET